MKIGGVFSGVGGIELGLRNAGHEIAFLCEVNEFCRRVLAKNFPGVPIYDDIRTLTADRLAADGIRVDGLCGGFPCQDLSWAGQGAGLYGERSGLWLEFCRLIGELRCDLALLENSAALLSRGLGDLLRDLAEIRYDAEWHCISAADIGAPHSRERLWLVAYPQSERPRQLRWLGSAAESEGIRDIHWPGHEPPSERMAPGLPDRLERVTALGNAVTVQIPELIGRAILAAEQVT